MGNQLPSITGTRKSPPPPHTHTQTADYLGHTGRDRGAAFTRSSPRRGQRTATLCFGQTSQVWCLDAPTSHQLQVTVTKATIWNITQQMSVQDDDLKHHTTNVGSLFLLLTIDNDKHNKYQFTFISFLLQINNNKCECIDERIKHEAPFLGSTFFAIQVPLSCWSHVGVQRSRQLGPLGWTKEYWRKGDHSHQKLVPHLRELFANWLCTASA